MPWYRPDADDFVTWNEVTNRIAGTLRVEPFFLPARSGGGVGGDDRPYTYLDKSRNSVDILLISDDRLGHLSDTQSNGPRCVAFQFDHLVGT